MLWVIAVMSLLVALAALFFAGTTLNKLNASNEMLTNAFKAEIKTLKTAVEKKTDILEERLDNMERNVNPLAKEHSNSTAELRAVQKEVVKLRGDLDRLDRSIPAQFRHREPDRQAN